MGFNDLLVHVDATANGQTRVQIAAQIAVRHRSHVTGFFVRKPPTTSLDLTFFADSDLEVPLYQRHLQRIGADDEAKLRQSREVFETELAREKIDGDWLVVDGSPAAAIEARIVAHESGVKPSVAASLVEVAHRVRRLRDQGLAEGPGTRLLVSAGRLIAEGIASERACQVAIGAALTDDPDLLSAIGDIIDTTM